LTVTEICIAGLPTIRIQFRFAIKTIINGSARCDYPNRFDED